MSAYFYQSAHPDPVGPYSLEELEELRVAGIIGDNTAVSTSGVGNWQPYSHVVESSKLGTAGAYVAPTGSSGASRISEQAVRERIAGAAEHAGRIAGDSMQIAGESLRRTYRSAVTVADKAVLFGSAASVVAFFLPWASAVGSTLSGFELAKHESIIWLLPISFAGVCFSSYLNVGARPRQRILRARWSIAVGTYWGAEMLVGVAVGNNIFGVAAIGAYLVLVAAAAVAYGGFAQIAALTAQ
jgi:hypothetical protein